MNSAVDGSDAATILADGLPKGFTVIFDTNGFKGPNIVSNCIGSVAGGSDTDDRLDAAATTVTTDIEISTTDEAAKCTNAQRVIKDQFKVQLRGMHNLMVLHQLGHSTTNFLVRI